MTTITNANVNNVEALRGFLNPSNTTGIKVDGNTISWPDDGWYEVQSAISYNTMSEGGQSATLPSGSYNVINHTSGERFENVVVGALFANRDGFPAEPEIYDPNPFGSPVGHLGGDEIPGINDLAESINEGVVAAIFDGLAARPDPPTPPATTTTSTVYGEGTPNETHVITTSTPDTSASTSNQPFTNTTTVINAQGVLVTETTVTSPTGMVLRPAGLNGVPVDEPEPSPTPSGSGTTDGAANEATETEAGHQAAPSGSGMGPDGASSNQDTDTDTGHQAAPSGSGMGPDGASSGQDTDTDEPTSTGGASSPSSGGSGTTDSNENSTSTETSNETSSNPHTR